MFEAGAGRVEAERQTGKGKRKQPFALPFVL